MKTNGSQQINLTQEGQENFENTTEFKERVQVIANEVMGKYALTLSNERIG